MGGYALHRALAMLGGAPSRSERRIVTAYRAERRGMRLRPGDRSRDAFPSAICHYAYCIKLSNPRPSPRKPLMLSALGVIIAIIIVIIEALGCGTLGQTGQMLPF